MVIVCLRPESGGAFCLPNTKSRRVEAVRVYCMVILLPWPDRVIVTVKARLLCVWWCKKSRCHSFCKQSMRVFCHVSLCSPGHTVSWLVTFSIYKSRWHMVILPTWLLDMLILQSPLADNTHAQRSLPFLAV